MREEDVQVLHGFASVADATAYLSSELFNNDVVRELGPLLDADPRSASTTKPDRCSTHISVSLGKQREPA